MLIGLKDAAEEAGFNSIPALKAHRKRPCFVLDSYGKLKVENNHPDWKLLKEQKKNGLLKKAGRPRKEDKPEPPPRPVLISDVIIGNDEDEEPEEQTHPDIKNPDEYSPEMGDLASQSLIAEYKTKIYESRIKEEKAKQEEIKTAELKKELAPMYLIKHFFSFGENMIHRSYRINHEIIPELNALFLSGKLQEAEQLLNERQETIVKESQADLIKAVREEGYNPE